MFMFFAQWFTDSFLRTSNDDPTGRKNTSNHEIDLCQIYGLDADKTAMLRSHDGGRLKSQLSTARNSRRFSSSPAHPAASSKSSRNSRVSTTRSFYRDDP